jgi:hypothetical protein
MTKRHNYTKNPVGPNDRHIPRPPPATQNANPIPPMAKPFGGKKKAPAIRRAPKLTRLK